MSKIIPDIDEPINSGIIINYFVVAIAFERKKAVIRYLSSKHFSDPDMLVKSQVHRMWSVFL